MIFFPGLHQPSDAKHFDRACISIKRLLNRKKPLGCPAVLIDSGAFTELHLHGGYRTDEETYATQLRDIHQRGTAAIEIAVAQDYMCEPFMLVKTGLTIKDHQRLTIERYDRLSRLLHGAPFPLMPVLQGYDERDYVAHVKDYGDRLTPNMWVGVGSVCKRNGKPDSVAAILYAILAARPDLRLHGFGVKRISLAHAAVRNALYSADSMAWSFAARWEGRNANHWQEAANFTNFIEALNDTHNVPFQLPLPLST